MKKSIICILITLTGITAACKDSSSSSDSDKGFILQPGLTKYETSGESYDVDYLGNETGTYAVIFQKEIDDINRIGIALTDDPYGTNFNLKIYFEGSSIPDAGEITTNNATIIIKKDNIDYSEQSVALTLNFVIEVRTKYTVYKISTASPLSINGNPLIINGEITALKVE